LYYPADKKLATLYGYTLPYPYQGKWIAYLLKWASNTLIDLMKNKIGDLNDAKQKEVIG
jgi:hypothetical protein